MLKLSKQVIYNKIEQCLIGIHCQEACEINNAVQWCGKLNAELLDQQKCGKTGCWNLVTNEVGEKCERVKLW